MSAIVRKNKPAVRRRALPAHEVGSGNVFVDIGMADPELELAKASVAAAIIARIDSLGLNQTQAAARMAIDQPRVSKIKCGRLGDFSLGALFELALKLGIDFDVKIGQKSNLNASGHLSVRGKLAAV